MSEKEPSSGALVVIRALVLVIAVHFLPLLVSGRWRWTEAWVFVAIQLGGFAVSRLLVARKHPDLLSERARSLEKTDAKPWDLRLVTLLVGASTLALVVAGLEARWSPGPVYPFAAKVAAVVVMLLGMAIGTWAMLENRFFSGLVRIQRDRGHTVVTTGPYAHVRHPGYVASFLVYLATPVLLDAVWALLPMLLSLGALVYRTHLEDETLQRELEGYKSYTKKTRYRLLPGVW